MNLQSRSVLPPTHPMPSILLDLAGRMRDLPPLADFHPSEANAIEYTRQLGHCLGPHVDDRSTHSCGDRRIARVSPFVACMQDEGGRGELSRMELFHAWHSSGSQTQSSTLQSSMYLSTATVTTRHNATHHRASILGP